MAEKTLDTTLRFKADITDFDAALKEANAAARRSNAEFKETASTMENWGKSTDGLRAKITSLEKVYQAEERKLQALQVEYGRVAKEQGENSEEAEKLATTLIEQQAKVNKTETEWKKYRKRLEEIESGAKDAAPDIEKAGDAAKEAGDDARDGAEGWTIAKDVIADFISNAISSAVDALTSVAEATRDYRREMAQLAQNAKDSGKDMGTMKEILADVAAVTGETDAAMEGLNMLMATGLDTTNLTNAAEAFAGAATKFDGLKFEGMAEGLQETLAVGSAVGPFAELIERMGGDLEQFNEGLAACTTQAERQQYAMNWLNESGLKEVHDSYVQNNADLVEAEKNQFKYNDALAKVGAAVEPINTALQGLGAIILEQVAPAIENIVTWVLDNLPTIGPIIMGIAAALGVLAAALAIQGIINGVSKAFALLNTTMLANPIVLVVAAIAGLVAAFVMLWNKSEAFRNFFINLWEGIKKAVSSAKESIVKTFNDVVSWVKGLPGKIGSAISGAIQTVTDWGKNLYSTAKTKISEFVSGVFTWASQVPDKIASAISGALQSVTTWGRNLLEKGKEAAGKLVSSVVDGVSSLPDKLLSVGTDLVKGLWNGISNSYQWIKDKISGWVGNVMDFIKGLFGIHSPSRVMRDEVGKMLGLGMAEGIEDSRSAVNGAVRKLGNAAMDGLPTGSGGGSTMAAAGGRSIVFNQYNNSPKALSRREIYRQTHNALAYAGGA